MDVKPNSRYFKNGQLSLIEYSYIEYFADGKINSNSRKSQKWYIDQDTIISKDNVVDELNLKQEQQSIKRLIDIANKYR